MAFLLLERSTPLDKLLIHQLTDGVQQEFMPFLDARGCLCPD